MLCMVNHLPTELPLHYVYILDGCYMCPVEVCEKDIVQCNWHESKYPESRKEALCEPCGVLFVCFLVDEYDVSSLR